MRSYQKIITNSFRTLVNYTKNFKIPSVCPIFITGSEKIKLPGKATKIYHASIYKNIHPGHNDFFIIVFMLQTYH